MLTLFTLTFVGSKTGVVCFRKRVLIHCILLQWMNALTFAESIINLDDQDEKIIYQSRKSLLLNQEQTWMKKGNGMFHVLIGTYDGAEVCELIGILLLNLL